MNHSNHPDLFHALHQREAGIERVLGAAGDERAAYIAHLETAIANLAASGATFTGDDVRREAGNPPAGVHFNVAGAVMSRMARLQVIERVGFAISTRVVGHGNLVRVWKGTAPGRPKGTDS